MTLAASQELSGCVAGALLLDSAHRDHSHDHRMSVSAALPLSQSLGFVFYENLLC